MKTIAIGITTTFDRQKELNACIKSLRDAGIEEKIYIYAEPDKWIESYKIEDKNIEIKMNEENLWCFRNFDNMITSLLQKWTDYIWLWQDDFVYSKDIKEKLDDIMKSRSDFWYYAMHTRPRMEKHIYKNWWNQVKIWRYARGMNYVMSNHIAWVMVRHPFYQNHLKTYTKNQQVDSCVSYVLEMLGLPMRYHNPSLSYHDWDSTIWHIDRYTWNIFYKECEPITIGIASIPNRSAELGRCIDSLYNQADKIIVGLNNYDEKPDFLDRLWIEVVIWDNSLGDAMKFAKIDSIKWFYITADDDLYYPHNYVNGMINRIEKYDRKVIVGTHGVIVPSAKINSYYADCIRYSYRSLLPTDNFVNVLGTGTTAFHTDTIKLSIKDFKAPNMADIRLWMQAQKQKVPMCCLKHNHNFIQTMNTNWSIREDKHNDDSYITDIVNSIKRDIRYLPQVLS